MLDPTATTSKERPVSQRANGREGERVARFHFNPSEGHIARSDHRSIDRHVLIIEVSGAAAAGENRKG